MHTEQKTRETLISEHFPHTVCVIKDSTYPHEIDEHLDYLTEKFGVSANDWSRISDDEQFRWAIETYCHWAIRHNAVLFKNLVDAIEFKCRFG